MPHSPIDRRHFLKQAGLTGLTAMSIPSLDFFQTGKTRRVALIGCGWYGKSDLFRLIQVAPVEVVGLSDPDQHMLEKAGAMVAQRQKSHQVPPLFRDYRELLSKANPEIVLVATPDHWHALAAIDAMKAGAHVYVQKPISADILEGEAMVAAARKYQRVVQVGLQRRSTPHFLDAKKNVVDAGLLGKVSYVELCCYFHMRSDANPPLQPVPDFFDYDLWTGPAPWRPFDGLPHRGWWRAFMEYGNGIVGDMCVHMFDAARWLLNLDWPTRVYSVGGIFVDKQGKSDISDTQHVVFEYPGLTCVWQHRTWGNPADPAYPWSLKLYGDKGQLSASTLSYDFLPMSNAKPIHRDVVYEKQAYPEDLHEPDIELHTAPATRRHMINFLQAIDTNQQPVADILQGHISTASCILGNLSMSLGRPLTYDPVSGTIPGDAEATGRLQRPYRSGYIHPGLGS